MAWVKLDDAMPHHPKVMAAGAQAFALDVAGICYSNKHATDGFIAAYALPAVLPSLSSPKRYAKKLVEVGRWLEADGGWVIHDVADYQPTAEQQKELSKKRAAAGKRGGSKSGDARRSKAEANAKQVASTESNPVPSRPEPKEEQPLGGEPPDAMSLAVDVEGWDVPFPVKAAGGSFTEAVSGWARKVGLEVPRHGPPQDLTKRLLEIVGDVLGEAKHSHGVKVALIGELIGDVTGQEVSKEAWGHLRRLVSTARPVPLLAAVTTALNGGAGLTGEYASDPLAISKYAVGVLNGNGRKHG